MVFVTGGTGFIGSHLLAALLKSGQQVIALKRPDSTAIYTENIFNYKFGSEGKKLFRQVQWTDGDIMDIYSLEDAMEQTDEVYHCAAKVSMRDENPDETIHTSEKGTENMVNAALNKGIKKFGYISSVAALGSGSPGSEIREENFEDFIFGKSPYFTAKHLAEEQVWRGYAEGLNVVVVAPSIVLGPWNGKNKGSMEILSFINRHSKFFTEGTMGFVNVNDVVEIMIRLMSENKLNERYILNSENISYRDLFCSISRNLNKPMPVIKLNYLEMRVFAALNNLLNRNKISRTVIEHSTGKYIYDNRKIIEALNGYNFIPVEKTIEETSKYFLNETGK